MTEALLALEDGTAFMGAGFGAAGESVGEIVFNTGMSGYQEVLTDPSYAGQIVVMTAPHVGNYGVNREDPESGSVHVAGFVVREAARRPSSWRSERSVNEYLGDAGVVGIEGIDTRALTLHIREAGAMRAAVSTEDLDPRSLTARARRAPEMLGADLAATVSAGAPYQARDVIGPAAPRAGRALRVAAFDWGLKRNSLRLLAMSGCETVVYPAGTPADEVLGGGYDGAFLSNGPGDPAATAYAVDTVRALLGRLPVFGICLGHQVLGRAIGGSTYKLKFGHRGANQPVLDVETGRVEITSHNHGFAVDPHAWGGAAPFAGRASLLPPASPASEAPRPGAAPPDRGARREGEAGPRSGGSEASGASGSSAAAPARGPASATRASELTTVDTTAGRVALTHWNLNDGTLEGMRLLDVPAFSVQYHPEAAPGPHDSASLFDRFVALMDGA
ncbi:MAG: glutamine-hydrolyzing carbamoyl-phosphate synthase small subunit [Actinomycetota bacterium]